MRPGGLLCFITSVGTLQSKSGKGFRAWLAERANLVGAMRLPGETFKANAGTEVTTDLIVLQKLGPNIVSHAEHWMNLRGTGIRDAEGHELQTNEYYIEHPSRMLGIPCDDKLHPGRLALKSQGNVVERMAQTFASFPPKIYRPQAIALESAVETVRAKIPPDADIKNFGYVAHGEILWQRRGDWLYPANLKLKTAERVLGQLRIRDAVQQVFEVQIRGGTDAELAQYQQQLNAVYDQFVQRYGHLTDSANAKAFSADPDAQLLLALEVRNVETNAIEKAAVFSQRTVRPRIVKAHAETAQEALLISLREYGQVVPGYLAQLLGKADGEVMQDLQTQGLAFLDPETRRWQTQDQYLSGDVRRKLQLAQSVVQQEPQFQANVEALLAVQPPDLGPGEIEVRLGAPWLPAEMVRDFAYDLLDLRPEQIKIDIEHSARYALWSVEFSKALYVNARNNSVYGTSDLSALDLLELSLNLKDAAVYTVDAKGDRHLDPEATLAARLKQQQVQELFKRWVWQDFNRSEVLCQIYNDLYNGTVARQYYNPNLEMPGSSQAIELRSHQKDAVWRILQSDATMLAHVVGAGKTFTMVAGAIELRRLGIAQKPMIVVPNHMLGQFTRELYQLYPNAKVLAPTEKDTQAAKRKELMARIATGDWDAVVVTHSAFTRLPLSKREKGAYFAEQVEAIDTLLGDRDRKGGNAIVKLLARERKKLKERIEQLEQSKIKDDGVTFEQLGIDALFVDEAHFWKNLGRSSKLQNIAGLSNTNSQRAMDAFMKCRIVRRNGGRLVFATGTPVSNSIAELFTMQRFLQPEALERRRIGNFDAWVGVFAEKTTAPEIDATGRFKTKTRLTKFTNVPELMTLFREVADIRTAAQLNLPRPAVERLTIASGASPLQLRYMERLVERAEAVAARRVEPDKDNMLWVTTDGRRAALDLRLIANTLPDYPYSKVNEAIANIHAIWQATIAQRTTQMVFCDLGTPKTAKTDGVTPFSLYGHLKAGLVARGIPAPEIAFIHDAAKAKDKETLFAALRDGRIRVLIGSTVKCGVGMNIQDRLIAEHHLDPPWRPSDIEQREGRILRQGNRNAKVLILSYVTQGREGQLGFDAYSWQTLARKAEMVAQVMNGDTAIRTVEDISSNALSFDEIKAIATGNPLIIEKATVDTRIAELSRYKQSYLNERYMLQRRVGTYLPSDIQRYRQQIQCLEADIQRRLDTSGDRFQIRIGDRDFDNREEAGRTLHTILAKATLQNATGTQDIGEFAGFTLAVVKDWSRASLRLRSPNGMAYGVPGGDSFIGLVRSMEHTVQKLDERLADTHQYLSQKEAELEQLSRQLETRFEYDGELADLLVRQQEINTELGLNKSDDQALAATESESEVETTDESVAQSPNENESENLVDLDALASNDASWDWLGEGETLPWDATDNLCLPTPALVELLDLLYADVPPKAELRAATRASELQLEPQTELTAIASQQIVVENQLIQLESQLTQLEAEQTVKNLSSNTQQAIDNTHQATSLEPKASADQCAEITSGDTVPIIAESPLPEIEKQLEDLRRWYVYAHALGRTADYLDRIKEVAQDFKQGQALSAKATAAMQKDVREYRKAIAGIIQDATEILQKQGQRTSGGIFYSGKNYTVGQDAQGVLSVRAQDRGVILECRESKVSVLKVNKQDCEVFRVFRETIVSRELELTPQFSSGRNLRLH